MITHRTAQPAPAALAALAAGSALLLAGCGQQSTDPATAPTSDAAPIASDAAAGATTAAPAPEAAEESTAAPESTDAATTDAAASGDDTGQRDGAGEATDGPSTVQVYVDALVASDWERAYAMLSPESASDLSLTRPDDLELEPWIEALQADLSDPSTYGQEWLSYPAWIETHRHEEAVTVRGCVDDGCYAYGFGVRQDESGAWVVDQSRLDVSTGGTWADFTNPDWEGTFDQQRPVSIKVTTAVGEPVAITLHARGRDESILLERTEAPEAHTYTATELTLPPVGQEVWTVSGSVVGSPMVRVHTGQTGQDEGTGG